MPSLLPNHFFCWSSLPLKRVAYTISFQYALFLKNEKCPLMQSSRYALFFSTKQNIFFFYFSLKTYFVGTHQKCLIKALLMCTHNICFHGEIRIYMYICCGYSLKAPYMFSWRNRNTHLDSPYLEPCNNSTFLEH